MDEARAVLVRLERIEGLDRESAHPSLLFAELRELVREAEEWARVDGDERAEEAVAALHFPRTWRYCSPGAARVLQRGADLENHGYPG